MANFWVHSWLKFLEVCDDRQISAGHQNPVYGKHGRCQVENRLDVSIVPESNCCAKTESNHAEGHVVKDPDTGEEMSPPSRPIEFALLRIIQCDSRSIEIF